MAKRSDSFTKTPETLRKAILAMKRKIDRNKKAFSEANLTVDVEMGDGRIVTRANPVVQEYRALVRDYSAALKAYKEIAEMQPAEETIRLEDFRAKFRVAK